MLPLFLYADGTWLSKGGRQTAKPLSMSIGNFPRAVMNLPEAKRVIAYMPELLGTEKQKKRKPFTAYKRQLYHDVLFEVLRRCVFLPGFWHAHAYVARKCLTFGLAFLLH